MYRGRNGRECVRGFEIVSDEECRQVVRVAAVLVERRAQGTRAIDQSAAKGLARVVVGREGQDGVVGP